MVRSPEQVEARPKADAAPRSQPAQSTAGQPLPPLIPKKRWPRRVLITMNIFVAVCILGAGSAYGYFEWRFGSIHKIDIRGLPGIRPAGENPGKVMNVLL